MKTRIDETRQTATPARQCRARSPHRAPAFDRERPDASNVLTSARFTGRGHGFQHTILKCNPENGNTTLTGRQLTDTMKSNPLTWNLDAKLPKPPIHRLRSCGKRYSRSLWIRDPSRSSVLIDRARVQSTKASRRPHAGWTSGTNRNLTGEQRFDNALRTSV